MLLGAERRFLIPRVVVYRANGRCGCARMNLNSQEPSLRMIEVRLGGQKKMVCGCWLENRCDPKIFKRMRNIVEGTDSGLSTRSYTAWFIIPVPKLPSKWHFSYPEWRDLISYDRLGIIWHRTCSCPFLTWPKRETERMPNQGPRLDATVIVRDGSAFSPICSCSQISMFITLPCCPNFIRVLHARL